MTPAPAPGPHAALPEQVLPLLLATPCPVAVFDPHDRLRWANPAFRALFDLTPDAEPTWSEMLRHNHQAGLATAVDSEPFERWLASAASRRGKLPYRQFETDLVDGRWLLMTETVASNGWMWCHATEITDLASDHRDLRLARDLAQRANLVDPLTSVGNRKHVLQRLQQALADPHGQPACVVMADLDHFKRINDGMGHAAGDQVLCHFAQWLTQRLRRADTFGRLGGEEFLIVLHDISPDGAEEVIQRLLEDLPQAQPLPEHPDFHYSCSYGLAVARPGDSPESVMARADAALYAAKQAGRSRCVRAPA